MLSIIRVKKFDWHFLIMLKSFHVKKVNISLARLRGQILTKEKKNIQPEAKKNLGEKFLSGKTLVVSSEKACVVEFLNHGGGGCCKFFKGGLQF